MCTQSYPEGNNMNDQETELLSTLHECTDIELLYFMSKILEELTNRQKKWKIKGDVKMREKVLSDREEIYQLTKRILELEKKLYKHCPELFDFESE